MSQAMVPQLLRIARERGRWVCVVLVSLFLSPCGGCSKRHRIPPAEVEAAAASQKDLEDAAVALVAEFANTGDEARQIELVQELAVNATPVARTQLDRIYRTTSDLRLKAELIQALAFIESMLVRKSAAEVELIR